MNYGRPKCTFATLPTAPYPANVSETMTNHDAVRELSTVIIGLHNMLVPSSQHAGVRFLT